ncbi:MAG: DNA polymerase III subunit delta [Phycisphaerae bacterium]
MAKKASKSEDSAPVASASPRVAIITGPESFMRTQETQRLRDHLIKQHGEVETFVFDGATAQAAEVLDECRSFGLMATHKLVIVDNAADLVKEHTRPLFEKYAEQPVDCATLVLRGEKWFPGKLDKLVEKIGAVIPCKELASPEAKAWLIRHAKSHHKVTLDDAVADALVQRVGSSQGKLDMEVGKLAAAAGVNEAGEPNPITRQLVAQFVGVSREEEAWNIQKTLLSGNPDAALQHLRHILDVSRQPTPVVMFALLDLARKLHGVTAGLKAGANPFQLTKPLKLWGQSQEMIVAAARRLQPADTLAFYRAAIDADQRSKSGLGEADRSMEMLVVKLCAMLR